MSLHRAGVFTLFTGQTILAAIGLLAALPTWGQYPGQITKTAKDAPILRAVGVLEWTGEPGKPKKSRLVPITVFDGEDLQDGGVYLARPAPLALASEVEYELEKNGKTIGLFDINSAGQEQGSWVGFGAWKPLPVVVPKRAAPQLALSTIDDEGGDRPVLHRKVHPGDVPATGKGSGGSSGSSSSAPAPAPDPDRPTLHKRTSSDDTANAGSSSAPDPDRPTLKPSKNKKKKAEDVGYVESLPAITDPDRPRLKRGKSSDGGPVVIPSLMGMPSDMQQAVAVSDARNLPDHPWSYTWANPEDEARMKAAMEDIARDALGLKTPPPAPAPARPTARTKTKLAPPPPPPPPAPLVDEQFRVFELAYGSGATLVLSARTDGPVAQQKFVTLVAQPDLYGNVLVLLKSVTDSGHLDVTPRMRLVDAVDAEADNRGELLFELRGTTQRQFALYRVLRGQAEKLFVTGGGEFGSQSMN